MAAQLSQPKEKPDSGDLRAVLAWNVRRYRVQRKLSQEQLAFESDLDRTYISALERCVWNVALSNVEKISIALGVPAWQLLYLAENAEQEDVNITVIVKEGPQLG
jgi:transcriptional regulator with XRE-family HTH domain